MTSMVYDDRISALAEGPLWHPLRKQLFWFDILGGKLHTRDARGRQSWDLGEYGSAAGWIDEDHLLIATETGLWRFNVTTGAREKLVALEADNPDTRCNDGRADPWGGFWIGTMGKTPTKDAGAFYRFYKGELRKLFGGIAIPNATCFAADRSRAFFADTVTHKVMQVALDPATGWPSGDPSVHIDFSADKLNPDGAVIDAEGLIWIAQWGASCVAAYDGAGKLVRKIKVPVPQVTCPAFGGADLSALYITTARENMDIKAIAQFPESGMVYRADGVGRGLPEYQVVL
ncbi:SMP-30/gluconolactonase/LRE family protein [Pelagibacterium sediminicola]|uniref:SMP-30/gluconolactonase/LRE family protein n=1 Tax=Pelagibacterium sediminicola TaxID=2248761 RepID=UPI000E317F75|nr:SMP-30/gluconolactonase/LRE family protein [Pelagibacterium sediminicola]